MSILKYVLADKERKEELREGYGDIWRHSNTYNMINNASMIPKVVAGVGGEYIKDFVDNTTFNPLPYGEYARKAHKGVQNIYGNTLDKAYDSVGNFFRPDRNQYVGPMGNPHTSEGPFDATETSSKEAQEAISSYKIPGYNRMVNEGYDSWSPSEGQFTKGAIIEAINEDAQNSLPYMTGVLGPRTLHKDADKSFSSGWEQGVNDTKSDWAKWKDSFKEGWEAK